MNNKEELRVMTPKVVYTKPQYIEYYAEIRKLLRGMNRDASILELQIAKNKLESFVKANADKKH